MTWCLQKWGINILKVTTGVYIMFYQRKNTTQRFIGLLTRFWHSKTHPKSNSPTDPKRTFTELSSIILVTYKSWIESFSDFKVWSITNNLNILTFVFPQKNHEISIRVSHLPESIHLISGACFTARLFGRLFHAWLTQYGLRADTLFSEYHCN